MKHMLIAQSGGPSAAINATVAGVVERCMTSGQVGRIYGARNGIKGVIDGNYIDLTEELASPERLELLCHTPAAALGSCRLKLNNADEEQLGQIVQALLEREIGYFVYIGGNDSMDTVHKLSDYIRKHNIQGLSVMGAPKTIDNDLPVTDHCPGFGSAAKYIAATFSEIVRDCEVYDIPAVTIVEVMGRNAGWLTAASALSRENGGTGPQLIYLCERAFDTERFLQDTVRDIVRCISDTSLLVNGRYPRLRTQLSDDVTFITSQELLDLYPDLPAKERENAFVREHPITFLTGIGHKLSNGQPHDGRAPDYDDWNLNGDLLYYSPLLDQAIELSSMGIRVDSESLDRQLTLAGCDARRALPFHRMLLDGELPLTIGGGIGQSRMCMLLLGKAHIGEVQSSIWDAATRSRCREAGITLL